MDQLRLTTLFLGFYTQESRENAPIDPSLRVLAEYKVVIAVHDS